MYTDWVKKLRPKTHPSTAFWSANKFDAGFFEGLLNGSKSFDISRGNPIG
jgi:hypothetical protein